MTKEEAVSIIEERVRVTEYVGSDYVDCVDIEALRIAIKALAQPEPQWIPVAERLPEIYQRVILCLTDGTAFVGYQGKPDCIWQVTEKDGTKLWVYDPDSYTDDIDSLPTAMDCWFQADDPDGISYTSITSLTYRRTFPGVVAWISLPEPYKGNNND